MTHILSFIIALWYSIMSFLNIPFTPADIKEKIILPSYEITLEDIKLIKNIFESETAWLASLQLENGAIPMTRYETGVLRMNPYFADYAALALLDNAEKYAENVKHYMNWHFAHLNTIQQDRNGIDGTIYDYEITVFNGVIKTETIALTDGIESYDSTDSYAATFLILLNKYYEKTGDVEYICTHKKDIIRVVGAMLSTFHNGLTCAKPDYEVKYLMDNCEVYRAVLDITSLIRNVWGKKDQEINEIFDRCTIVAQQIEYAVNCKLWNFRGGYYVTNIDKNSLVNGSFSWRIYYPCATAQLFPILFGVIDPDSVRSKLLYDEFCENYVWENFDIPDVFYWGSNVQVAVRMNDLPRVLNYLKNYEKLTLNHEYPLYNADIARVSMAVYELIEKFNNN